MNASKKILAVISSAVLLGSMALMPASADITKTLGSRSCQKLYAVGISSNGIGTYFKYGFYGIGGNHQTFTSHRPNKLKSYDVWGSSATSQIRSTADNYVTTDGRVDRAATYCAWSGR